MITRINLSEWTTDALKFYGGSASIVQVCQYVWKNYADQLREAGDLFFTWQYDIRWAATVLRKKGIIRAANLSQQGIWELT